MVPLTDFQLFAKRKRLSFILSIWIPVPPATLHNTCGGWWQTKYRQAGGALPDVGTSLRPYDSLDSYRHGSRMSRVGQTAPDSALGEPNHGTMGTKPVTLSQCPMHFP